MFMGTNIFAGTVHESTPWLQAVAIWSCRWHTLIPHKPKKIAFIAISSVSLFFREKSYYKVKSVNSKPKLQTALVNKMS